MDFKKRNSILARLNVLLRKERDQNGLYFTHSNPCKAKPQNIQVYRKRGGSFTRKTFFTAKNDKACGTRNVANLMC